LRPKCIMNKKRMERINRRESEIKLWNSAHILASMFVQRWDVYGMQLADGRYVSIKEPLTGRHLMHHLSGKITLGVYVLNEDSETTLTVLDADDDVQYYQLFRLADELAKDGIPSYLERSRRGGHMWLKHSSLVSGLEAKTFGEELLAEIKLEPMEVFPKQEELRNGPGSLIRLPFGVHRKSGSMYPFVNREDGLPTAGDIHQQIALLRNPKTVSREALDEYTHFALTTRRDAAGNNTDAEPDNIWKRIRQTQPAIDFIGRYIELTPTATGGVGYCPFHEDQHMSFGVNEKGNYWHCFAGCGGGSIIDFWMKWRQLEFGEAVHELSEMLEL